MDQQLLEEYKVSESAEFHIGALFQQLLEATAQGNTISPIHFDAQAYKASEAYQLTDEVKQYADDYLTYKEEQERFREELKKAEELENRPFHEKAWDTVKTLTGEITGYYDFIRASEGVDPVTGEKLTDGQRVAAGAMASAGLIPIVGCGGRLLKGGSAIYKTAKGMNAADQALDVYKTTKTFSNLEKAELGIYGLTSANGLSEYITGKDMFGNELTDIQRQQSLYYSILGPALMASPFVPTLIKNGKLVKDETITQIHKLATKTKSGAQYVYNEVKGGTQVLLQNQSMNFAFAGTKPILSNVMNPKEISKRIEEVVSKFSFGKSRGVNKGADDVGGVISKGIDNSVNFGKYSTTIDDKVKVIEKEDLPDWISESFTDSNYRTVITEENITFYRTYGGVAKANGSFVTTSPAGNRINAKINTALVPDWKNSREYEAVIEVPKGQILNIGRVEKQYTKTGALLEGDGDQILLPQGWPSKWIKEIRKVPSK